MNFANVTDWIIPEGDVNIVKDSNNQIIWMKPITPGPSPDPESNVPFYIKNEYSTDYAVDFLQTASHAITIEYSYDNSLWRTLGTTTRDVPLSITIPANSSVYFRAETNYWNGTIIQGAIFVGGNIMSLIYGSSYAGKTSFPSSATFQSLFESTNIKYAYKLSLPATTLGFNDYAAMFKDCINLVSAPALPATTLGTSSYGHMFYNCISLINAPELSVTTLSGSYCCTYMFYGCSRLKNAPSILKPTTLRNSCYEFMFALCSSLEKSPDLPATTMLNGCYFGMFLGSVSLNNVKCLATTNIAQQNSTGNISYGSGGWMKNTAATGTFIIARNTLSQWRRDEYGIPSGWTVVEQ